jgi:hypothetical protein
MKIWIAVIGVTAALAGCATPYQSVAFRGGFDETPLAPNVFQVRFQGNGHTNPERAADFALLRSAEVALGHGYTHFAIVDSRNATKFSTWTSPQKSHTTYDIHTSNSQIYGTADTTYSGGQTTVWQKPSTSHIIVCFTEKPAEVPLAYDAAFVRASLRQKYGLDD